MSYCKNHKSYSCGCSCTNCSCLFPSNSECLKYKGSYLECLDIANGDVLTDIIVKINDAICEGIVPASGNIYILESCDSNITVSSETSGNTTTYTICLSDTITDQLTENTTNIASLQTCCDESIKELISSDGSVIVSDNGSGTWDITISNPSGNFWNLEGNGGTDPNVNFIGTTDSSDLVFKVNNTEAGRLTDLTPGNTSYGINSLTSISSGLNNSAFGGGALASMSAASNNTSIGSQSLINLSTGGSNTALGYSAGDTITTGTTNTIIGNQADVSSNSAIGRIALGSGATASADYQFALPDNVTTFKWRGITYTMPSVNAAGVLTNDGSGNLTWA